MPITVMTISKQEADEISNTEEGQFSDVKALEIAPKDLTKTISAFANSDGGDLYIGIDETKVGAKRVRRWRGFENQEAANGHIQCFESFFPLGQDFQYDFVRCPDCHGLVLHALVMKTKDARKASNGMYYTRRGAQSLPADTDEKIKRLEYTKGVISFETDIVNAPLENVTESDVIKGFIKRVVPRSEPFAWLKRQSLIRDGRPTVAGLLLFSDEPQASLPKRCGIKVYRYKTKDAEGSREALVFDPISVEGPLYDQIKHAVDLTTTKVEEIPKLGTEAFEKIEYPQETLHEIITNAVLHRDYSIADDVHIRIFDNRIEVQSPGRLPAHITPENILLAERFARNGQIVRLLNKFPNPPNKDVGEGLRTAIAAMHKLGLKEPVISETQSAVLVSIRHEPLASPEEAIMDYLSTHETINNSQAREATHISKDWQIRGIFHDLVKRGMIERIPGTRTRARVYRKTDFLQEVKDEKLSDGCNTEKFSDGLF